MALLNDILKWTESLPLWQRDACRRLLQKEDGLGDIDYSELYALLKKENGIGADDVPEALPLSNEHLPTGLASGDAVILLALRNLENVNQIPSNHVLSFSDTGMTVIYGGNGTGKSGYARVMKRACRARDQSESIHPNAHDPKAAKKEPTAKFDVKVGSAIHEVKWSRDAVTSDLLSSISGGCSKFCVRFIG